jgi:hypothetical protein
MKRFVHVLAGATATASLALLAIGTPAASAATTYNGIFRGDIAKTDCSNPPPWQTTSGTWSVTLHGSTATATFDIYVDGAPHFAYKFPGMKQLSAGAHELFSVTGLTGAGPLTVTATDKGKFSYTIAPYNLQYDENTLYSCASVTYPGRVTS